MSANNKIVEEPASSPVRSDEDRAAIDSRNQAEGWDWLRRQRQSQSNPASQTAPAPGSPVLSDYEKDDRESELQIEAFDRLIQERKARLALAIADDAGGGP